jgi:hypothetical protein
MEAPFSCRWSARRAGLGSPFSPSSPRFSFRPRRLRDAGSRSQGERRGSSRRSVQRSGRACWSVLPQPVTIRIKRGAASSATPGEIVLDASLLDAGSFSWGVIQHEFAHEVDFLVLDDADRVRLQAALGASSWWPADGLAHPQLGCERFASTLAWAYWPSRANVMRPASTSDEAGSLAPAAFRTLLDSILRAHQI